MIPRAWLRLASPVWLLSTACCLSCGGGGGAEPQARPPVITGGPSATNITPSGASVAWATDELCDSRVRYGTTGAYADSVYDAGLTRSHTMAIDGLDPSTTYHYQVASRDAEGLSVASDDRVFQTLALPPPPVIVSGPTATGVTPHEVMIGWTTDRQATSKVRFGQSVAYTDSAGTETLVVAHSVRLRGLTPGLGYHYSVASRDQWGRWVASGDRTFETESLVDSLTADGWIRFERQEFGQALLAFQEASSLEPMSVPVMEGLGWCLLRLYRFEECRMYLEQALALEPSRIDCLAAAVFLDYSEERFDDAIAGAGQVLGSLGDAYVFAHDPTVGSSDLRYCVLLAHAAKGDLAGALEQAKILDPSTTLSPDDPATWDGHASFEEAFMALVEYLAGQV